MWFSETYGNYTYLRLDDDGRHRFNLRIVVPSRAVTMDMAFMRFAGPADMKIDAFELVFGSDPVAMDPTDENLRN